MSAFVTGTATGAIATFVRMSKKEKTKKSKKYQKQKMPKRQKRLFLCGNYLDNVAVFEFVTLFDAHLCLCIDCVEETLSDIGVHLIGEIVSMPAVPTTMSIAR